MKLNKFTIGCEFSMSNKNYRCTDVGTRVVVAIEIDDRSDRSWFDGPPFAVMEKVFDENDLSVCEILAKGI